MFISAASLPLYETYLPVAAMVTIGIGFALFNLVFSSYILPRFFKKIKPSKVSAMKSESYECGVAPEGEAKTMVSVRFYLVALLFLLFDMETIYIVAWALIFRGALTSPEAVTFLLAEMGVFLTILLVGYAYAWKKGALSWS